MFCIRIRFLWLQPKIWIRSDFRIHPFSLYPPNRNLNNFYSSGKFIIKKIVDWKEQYLRMMAKEANWNKNLLITVNKCSFVIFYTFLHFFNTFLSFRFGSVFRIPVPYCSRRPSNTEHWTCRKRNPMSLMDRERKCYLHFLLTQGEESFCQQRKKPSQACPN